MIEDRSGFWTVRLPSVTHLTQPKASHSRFIGLLQRFKGGKMSPGGLRRNSICPLRRCLRAPVPTDQLTLSHSSCRCPGIPHMAADEGDCPGFGDLDHLPEAPCSHPQLPHPRRGGLHAAPLFLECRLSAPSSTKETLTAINYRAGRTRGIPPGGSSDRCFTPRRHLAYPGLTKRAAALCPPGCGGGRAVDPT